MRRLILGVALALLLAAVPVYAQGGGGGGAGGGRGTRAGGTRGGGMAADLPYTNLIQAVADCNLEPAFTLTADQKTAIKKIRDDLKAAQDKWQTDHAADLTKLQQDLAAARGAGEDTTSIAQKRTDLLATRPKSDDAQAAIKKLLTPDELTQVEAKVTELTAARGGARRGGGAGGAGGGGGGI